MFIVSTKDQKCWSSPNQRLALLLADVCRSSLNSIKLFVVESYLRASNYELKLFL